MSGSVYFEGKNKHYEDSNCHVHCFGHGRRTINTYKMSDDWGRVYARMLQESITNMPGTYPETPIEEAS